MATSHDIGAITGNQLSSFGNMAAYSRTIPTFGMQQQAFAPMTSPMPTMGAIPAAFTPSGPAFSPPGGFPGQNLQRSSMAVAGGMAEAGGMLIPGKTTGGLAGAGIGFMMGGPAGAILGGGIGLAGGAVGDFISNTITMTNQNMSATGNMMQAQRFQFGRAGGMATGGGFTSGQIGGISQGIMTAGMADPATSVAEIRDITSQLGNMGVFQIAKDVPSIMGKLSESLRALKAIAVSAQTTLSEAVPILAAMRGAGITSGSMAAGVSQFMVAGQRSGVSFMEQLQAGTNAAQNAMSSGLSGAPAFVSAVQTTQSIARARQSGAISEADFQRMTMGTGQASVAAAPIIQATQAMAMGPMGLISGGSGMTTRQMGGMGIGAALGAASANLGSPDAIVHMLNRQDQVSSAMMSDQFALVRSAQSMARELPGDRDEMSMLVLQRRFGLNSFQARMEMQRFNSRHESQMMEQADIQRQQNMEVMSTRLREMRPDFVFKRAANTATQRVFGDAITRLTWFRAGAGTMMENLMQSATGAQPLASGPEVQMTMARMLAGTAGSVDLQELKRTGMTDVTGTAAVLPGANNPLVRAAVGAAFPMATAAAGAFIDATSGRRGGIMAEHAAVFGITGTDAEKDEQIAANISVIRQMQGQAFSEDPKEYRSNRLKAIEDTKLQSRVSAILGTIDELQGQGQLRGDVVEQANTVASKVYGGNSRRREIMLALSVADASKADSLMKDTLASGANTAELTKEMSRHLGAAKDALLYSTSKVPLPGGLSIGVGGVGAADAELATTLAQDPNIKSLFMKMTEAYADDKTQTAGQLEGQVRGVMRMKGFSDMEIERFNTVAGGFKAKGGQDRAKKFVTSMGEHEKKKKLFESASAREMVSGMIASGLEAFSGAKDGSETATTASLVRSVMTQVGSGTAGGFTKAHQALVAHAIGAFASQSPERIKEVTEVLEATGLGSITEAITSKLSQEEITGITPGAIIKTQQIAEAMLTKNAAQTDEARKAAARGLGGTGQEVFNQRLTEYVKAQTELMLRVTAGDAVGARAAAQSALGVLTGATSTK